MVLTIIQDWTTIKISKNEYNRKGNKMEDFGIIILIAIVAVIMVFVGVGMGYLRRVKEETGYNPLGFINSALIVGVYAFPLLGIFLVGEIGPIGFIVCLLGILCIVGLVARNRVLGDKKTIALVTFFQIFAAVILWIVAAVKRNGGLSNNAAYRSNMR